MMSANVVEVQGTLRPDGTLVLDETPALPPGGVLVLVQPLTELAQTPVWQTLEGIWAGQRARDHVPRTREEIDADLAAMREDDEQRLQAIERLHQDCERARRQAGESEPK